MVLFSRKGFEETSVEDICMAAGYSKGGFYFHFKGKDELLLGILEDPSGLADRRQSEVLAAELWAQASRNEAVRAQLSRHHEIRRGGMLQSALAAGRGATGMTRLLDLLLLLDAGLAVQERFLTTHSDEARTVVDSLTASLASPSAELGQLRRRVAGVGR
jgi:AcrR family transcriptional regulator